MARTTATAVKDLLQSDYDVNAAPPLTVHLRSACAVVNRVAICAANKGLTLTAEELQLVETWLAAHYYCCNDPTYQSKSTEGGSGSFTGQSGMKFESTRYGQAALTLDYSGCLEAIGKRQFASAGWLGKVPSERIPYNQRD